jgi:hypothetical protein
MENGGGLDVTKVQENLTVIAKSKDTVSKMEALETIQLEMVRTFSEYSTKALFPKEKMDSAKILTNLIRNLSSTMMKQREIELRDEVDFESPKVMKGMYFLVEVFFESMNKAGLTDDQVDKIKHILQTDLVGFGERLNSELRSISGQLIDTVKNPLFDAE